MVFLDNELKWSSLLDFEVEVGLRDQDHANLVAVKQLAVVNLLCPNRSFRILGSELHPDVAVRLLLYVDAIDASMLGTDRSNLVLDVHEKTGVLPQVHLGWVEHP